MKFGYVIPHDFANFSRNEHITAKFGSQTQDTSLSDAIFTGCVYYVM